MAVWYTRSARSPLEKTSDAIQWALKVTAHLNKVVPEAHIEVLSNIAGDNNEIHWVMRTESLEKYDEFVAKIGRDEGYKELLREVAEQGLFSSSFDHLYRVL